MLASVSSIAKWQSQVVKMISSASLVGGVVAWLIDLLESRELDRDRLMTLTWRVRHPVDSIASSW